MKADNGHMSNAGAVPAVALGGGGQMPMLGFGTWRLRGRQACESVQHALRTGYRHIDTATMYANEDEVGRALRDSEVDRADVFITTKLRPSDAGRERAVLKASLRALGTDYIDLWLVHWPPRARIGRHVWHEFLALRDEGLTRAVGVSNYSVEQLDDLIEATGTAPSVNQVHWDPARYDAAFLAANRERGVAVEGYSPLKDTDLAHPVLTEIAAAHGATAAQVVLRWHIEHQVTVIPRSSDPGRIAANFDIFGFVLDPDEVRRIDDLADGR
ncbi:MAG TPA: aldo/keto reductase [Streptosporangiaceae bacterium]|jgi:diketogulonate reductase-like aldo/keto reductase